MSSQGRSKPWHVGLYRGMEACHRMPRMFSNDHLVLLRMQVFEVDSSEVLLRKKAALEAVLSRDKVLQGSLPQQGARKPRCALLAIVVGGVLPSILPSLA